MPVSNSIETMNTTMATKIRQSKPPPAVSGGGGGQVPARRDAMRYENRMRMHYFECTRNEQPGNLFVTVQV